MSHEAGSDRVLYSVVINQQEQYAIWPAHTDLAPGWMAVGKEGSKQECLAYIQDVWVDMRPKTLRDKMSLELQ